MTSLKLKMPFVMLALASAPLHADEICAIQAAVRCSCPASMVVTCQSGRQGFVDDAQLARSITISVTNTATGDVQTVVLNDPPSGIRSYYANLNEDPWIVAQLGAQGLTNLNGLILNVKSIRFGDEVVLYASPHKNDSSDDD